MVFVAELIGDKLLYTISVLTTRYRPLPMFCGMVVAFMAKMLAAVLLGQVISELPVGLVATMSAVTFFIIAFVLWFKEPDREPLNFKPSPYWSTAALTSFSVIFFSEWGDVGQITVVTLTARYQTPLIIWVGATLAMITKALLAMTLGFGLRKWVPKKILRYCAVVVCLVMGILSVLKIS